MRNREKLQDLRNPEIVKDAEGGEKKEAFINAINRQLEVMEQSGEITTEQADEKRQAASLIEVGFSNDPEYDAELFIKSGIIGEEEMIELLNRDKEEDSSE